MNVTRMNTERMNFLFDAVILLSPMNFLLINSIRSNSPRNVSNGMCAENMRFKSSSCISRPSQKCFETSKRMPILWHPPDTFSGAWSEGQRIKTVFSVPYSILLHSCQLISIATQIQGWREEHVFGRRGDSDPGLDLVFIYPGKDEKITFVFVLNVCWPTRTPGSPVFPPKCLCFNLMSTYEQRKEKKRFHLTFSPNFSFTSEQKNDSASYFVPNYCQIEEIWPVFSL